MDLQETLKAIDAWPLEDQLHLVFQVWDRIVANGWEPQASDELRAVLRRRLAKHQADPRWEMAMEQVLAHVRRARWENGREAQAASPDSGNPMNLDANPTLQQLRELLIHCDDSAGNHVLWVKKNGDVEISRIKHPRVDLRRIRDEPTVVKFQHEHPEMQMRCETFLAGNRYVGPEAAEEYEWLPELFETLLSEWRKAKGQPEVRYVPVSDGVKKD